MLVWRQLVHRNWHSIQCVKSHWILHMSWWRHQMEKFSALLAICAGNSPLTDAVFDLCPNIRLSKQWWGWWFETPWRSSWRDCHVWKSQQVTQGVTCNVNVKAACTQKLIGYLCGTWDTKGNVINIVATVFLGWYSFWYVKMPIYIYIYKCELFMGFSLF